MTKKTVDERIQETLDTLAQVNSDAMCFVYYCLYVAQFGALYGSSSGRRDMMLDLTGEVTNISNAISLGNYLIGDKDQRSLRRAVMLLGRTLNRSIDTLKTETEKKSKDELRTQINEMWRNNKIIQVTSFVGASELARHKDSIQAAYNSFTADEQKKISAGIATDLYDGSTSDDKYKADSRALLLLIRRVAQGMAAPVGGTDAFMTAQKQLVKAMNVGQLQAAIKNGWWTHMDSLPENQAMQALLLNFNANPLTFMRSYSIHPMDGVITAGDIWTLRDVEATKRVEPRLGFTRRVKNEVGAFDLTTIDSTARGTPMYFLPWLSQRIIKIDIPNGGPNIFFTAAINGCSVFVTGTARNPMVYHAGIDGDLKGDTYNGAFIDVKQAATASNAPLFWRRLLKHLVAALNDAGILGEVNKHHYVRDLINNPKSIIDTNNKITVHARQFEQTIRAQAGLTVTYCSPWGCVFGVRDNFNQNWAFYLQENVTIHYKRNTDNAVFMTCRPIFISKIFPVAHAIANTHDYANVPSNFETVYDGLNVQIPNPFVESVTVIKK